MLETECGHYSVRKIKKMIQDKNISKNEFNDFITLNEKIKGRKYSNDNKIVFEAEILTSG